MNSGHHHKCAYVYLEFERPARAAASHFHFSFTTFQRSFSIHRTVYLNHKSNAAKSSPLVGEHVRNDGSFLISHPHTIECCLNEFKVMLAFNFLTKSICLSSIASPLCADLARGIIASATLLSPSYLKTITWMSLWTSSRVWWNCWDRLKYPSNFFQRPKRMLGVKLTTASFSKKGKSRRVIKTTSL